MRFSNGDSISNIILPKLKSCITQYSTKYKGLDMLSPWRYDDQYSFKKFEFADDGYKEWHTEQRCWEYINQDSCMDVLFK